MIQHVKVTKIRGKGVPVLVGQPFPFGGVCVSCANVLGLEMLKLAVDVVSVTHGLGIQRSQCKSTQAQSLDYWTTKKKRVKYCEFEI